MRGQVEAVSSLTVRQLKEMNPVILCKVMYKNDSDSSMITWNILVNKRVKSFQYLQTETGQDEICKETHALERQAMENIIWSDESHFTLFENNNNYVYKCAALTSLITNAPTRLLNTRLN